MKSEGGSLALVALSSDATVLFNADGLELSLTLTARNESGEERGKATVTFVSSARGFDGLGLTARFAASELAAGMEVFAAPESGLTIWHSANESETYTLEGANAGLFTVGADGAVSVKEALSASPEEVLRYALRLELRGGGTVSERSLLLELRPPSPGLENKEVEVPALSESSYALLTVSPTNGGTVQGFADVNGFGSEGGTPATISLSSDATVLFDMDGLELTLTLTASSAGGAATATVRFVSSARGFNGAGLRRAFSSNVESGEEVFGSSESGLTIWHSANESESYELEGTGAGLFAVGLDGAVTALESLSVSSGAGYDLTLVLRGGGTVSRRDLGVELTPLLSDGGDDLSGLAGTTVTVRSEASADENVWALSLSGGSSVSSFEERGLKSEGGSLALVALSSDATVLFNADGLELSLTLTARNESGEERGKATVTFVSSARGFDGLGLTARFAASELAAGMEVFAATESGLTIWHSANESESYTLEGANAGLFTVGADGAVSVKEALSASPEEVLRYALRLELRGGGTVSERSLLLELRPPSPGLENKEVEVPALSESSYALLTVSPTNGGTVRGFADVNGFGSEGGTPATISLSSDATVLFDMDGLELTLTLTASSAGGAATATVRFVSSARGFNGAGLRRAFSSNVESGEEVFGSSESGLTIWHSANESESYELEGTGAGLFAVGLDGAVTALERLSVSSGAGYDLTLVLRGGGTVSRRDLGVELTPSLSDGGDDLSGLAGTTVTVRSEASADENVWALSLSGGSRVSSFEERGLKSEGGSLALVALSSDATVLFNADGLELSLALTARNESGEERGKATVTFVSSARGFDGEGLTALFAASELAAGMEVFAAAESGLTIWHSANESETYTLEGANANLFTVGTDGAVSVKEALSSSSSEVLRYALRLELRGGGTVSERSLLLELRPPSPGLDDEEVEVPALSKRNYALLTVSPTNGGTVRGFADVNGFGSGGGTPATISLSSDATVLFDMDELELTLTLTASSAGGTVSSAVRFVSSARGFNGTGLRRAFSSDVEPGEEVFGSSEAGLTIWHSANESESYALEGTGAGLFAVGLDGAVTALERLSVSSGAGYDLTLVLRGGGTVSRRDLGVELTPSLSDGGDDLSGLAGTTVTVRSEASADENVWALSLSGGSRVSSFEERGLKSEGGSLALVALSSDATVLFNADGLELSLALTARNERGEERGRATVTFVSSARGFDGEGLTALFAATELAAGMEVFAAAAAGLTIWHSANESESYTLEGANAGLFTVGADGAVSVKEALSASPEEVLRYALRLELRGGGTVSERSLLLELRPPSPGLENKEVEVPALSESSYALLTVSPTNGGTVQGFADVNGFGSEGGTPATISLSSDATVLFDMDGLELTLTLTASSAGGTVSSAVRFVSSARGFNGAGLRRAFSSNVESGEEVFGSSESGLTIWHSANESESYELEGTGAGLFAVGLDGAVTALESLSVSSGAGYDLTLVLRGGGTVSRRDLGVELTPLLSDGGDDLSGLAGTTVTVRSEAVADENVWALSLSGGSSVSSFEERGLKSEGGSLALVALSSLAVELFTLDGLELSLTLTARNESGEERGKATVTFVSSARGFDGLGLTARFAASELAAGMEVFAAPESGLTIWHSANESESYTLEGANAGLFTVGADGAVSVKEALSASPEEVLRYALRLELRGGGTVSERSLLLELRPPSPGLENKEVEVPALSESSYALLTVSPTNGGTVQGFADVNGFGSEGGTPATISLSSDATVLFDMDGLELTLTLTASSAGGTVSSAVRFVSSARGFNGAGLRRAFSSNVESGEEVFGSSESGLTIWHSANESESYELEGTGAGLFAVGLDGAVTALESLSVSSGAGYDLTLVLRGGGTVSRRDLGVELTPLLSDGGDDLSGLAGTTVTVRSEAVADENVWALSLSGGSSVSSFEERGLKSEGGSLALVALSSLAVELFTLDGLELSLTLTARNESGEERGKATVTFVSSARGFDGLGLTARFAASELAAGMEVFAAPESGLTIWHSANESEAYTLEGANANLFTVGADGAVSVKTAFSLDADARYTLTLILRGGEAEARRGLTLELLSPFFEAAEEPVTVAADALAGVAVFTLSLARQAGVSFDGVEANGLRTEGGNEAEIFLSSSAVNLFTLDRLELSLTLTARDNLRAETTTMRFVSAARGFMGEALTTSFVAEVLSLGVEVFGSSSVSLTIWHNRGGEEEYELLGSDAGLFTVGADGGVSVKEDLRPLDAIRYELTLALSGGGTVAHRELIVRLSPFPGSPFIYTDDEEEGDGSAENPFLIYDLYQLQWINGALPEAAWDFLVSFYEPYKSRGDLETIAGLYFTGAADTNLDSTVHYRLASDIDASPTRQWQNGFASIGGAQSFNGSFDGDGREIRGLFARNADGGLFSQIGAGGTAQSLYLRDVDIEAETAGSFAGTNRGRISRAGATGRVVGETAGGLAGDMAGEMIESWFVGEVEGELFGGGVSGIAEGLHRNNWAMARVTANSPPGGNVGGYAGQITNAGGIEDSWAGGEESGFFGNRTDEQSVAGYFDRATAGRLDIETITETSLTVFSVDTMATVTNTAWSTAAWNFGKIVAGENNAADYPFLSGFEDLWPGRQALAFADFQTRLLTSDGILFAGAALSPGERLTLVLDANGLASDDGATPVAQCEDDGAGGIVASANYNEVTIGLRAAAPGILSRVSDSPISDCEFVVGYAADAQAPAGSGFFMLMTIAAGEASLSRSYPFLSLEDADGDFWRGDLDSDGIPNAYDLTPSAEFPVDLFFGADGTAERPWPIYNVWHLQAIDGERVGIIGGLVSDSAPDNAAIAIFGDSDAERLGAHYRLMADIDASPTRAWSRTNNQLGFQPLGWRNSIFQGSFDGRGREIRNLFMRRGVITQLASTNYGINAGLFAVVGASATVRNLGLLDLDFRSEAGLFIGGLAGVMSGVERRRWCGQRASWKEN